MGKSKTPKPTRSTDIYNQATSAYQSSQNPSALENKFSGIADEYGDAARTARATGVQDYGNIMKGYQDFSSGLGGPTKFSFERINPTRSADSDFAMQGYKNFANTGGYSDQDITDLRARGIAPIRAAYGNTMMEMDRARAIGGAGGSPNYIAAASRAQRDMPGQMSDAMQNVNAGLADAIRSGKLSGLAGVSGISEAEAGRQMQASLANQGADIQTQGMGEASLQNLRQSKLGALSGMNSLYGTAPGMASKFGDQALSAYGQQAGMEGDRRNYGMNAMQMQQNAAEGANKEGGTPWWKKALSVAATVAPYAAMAMSSRELKEDITPIKNGQFAKHLKELPLYTWKYKGEKVKHFGPMAEEFKDKFGVGDGKTLHLADVMGVMLASQKEALKDA